MKGWLVLSLGLSLLVFALFSWPLPRYLGSGVVHSAQGEAVQEMPEGDHLQLMYHYWLFQEFMTGKTPAFHNLYEFNTGDDDERKALRAYFFPLSLVFAAGNLVGGLAFGWNLTAWVSVWLSLWLMLHVLARFSTQRRAVVLGAVVAVLIPWRWDALFGGSPAGFSLVFVPMVWLGLDLMLRDNSWRGAVLLGSGVMFAAFCDSHIFYFSALFSPLFALLTWLQCPQSFAFTRANWLRKIGAASVLIPFALLVAGYSIMKKKAFAETVAINDLAQVRIYSPNWQEVVPDLVAALGGEVPGSNTGTQVYLGVGPFLFLGLALVLLFVNWRRDHTRRNRLLLGAAVGCSVVAVVWLAMGVGGSPLVQPYRLARKLIPGYGMMRQPAKVYCMLPGLFALATTLLVSELVRLRGGGWSTWLGGGLVLWLGMHYALHLHPSICLLQNEQGAYQAVVDDAAVSERQLRALAVPLWPGDSAPSSVYEHFAARYRIKMVNGYSPVVAKTYKKEIFERLQGINQGALDAEGYDELLRRGVGYVLFHENLAPEKVSPFAPGATLDALLREERLALLQRSGPVWAFRILEQPRTVERQQPTWIFGSRTWDPLREACRNTARVEEPAALGGSFVRLHGEGSQVRLRRSTRLPPQPGLRWSLRLRGAGAVWAVTIRQQEILSKKLVHVNAKDWQWLDVPLGWLQDPAAATLLIKAEAGTIDFDALQLRAGTGTPPAAGEQVTIPAASFFHHAETDPDTGSLTLRRLAVPPGAALRGPRLTLEPGEYRFTLNFSSDAPDDTVLGSIFLSSEGVMILERQVEVRAGQAAVYQTGLSNNKPITFTLHKLRNADMTVRDVVLERLR